MGVDLEKRTGLVVGARWNNPGEHFVCLEALENTTKGSP